MGGDRVTATTGKTAARLKARERVAAQLRRRVLTLATVLLIGSALLYTLLIVIFVTDGPGIAVLSYQLPGTRAVAVGAGLGILLGAGFLTGAWLLVVLDIVQRQTRRRAPVDTLKSMFNNLIRYPVRPLGTAEHAGWAVGFAVLYVIGYPFQLIGGLLAPGVLDGIGHPLVLHTLVLFPALTAAAASCATLVSLLKKLSYPGQLRRHPSRSATAASGWLHTALYRQRLDLVSAALGGAVLGFAALPASTGATEVAGLLAAVGTVFVGVAVALGLQFWRIGETLHLPGASGRSRVS
jgi:hypothetical protein